MCPEERRICKALVETSLGDYQFFTRTPTNLCVDGYGEELSWKLGRMKDSLNQGIPISIGEIMAGAYKHAATDKTKDQEEVGKGQGGSSQTQN